MMLPVAVSTTTAAFMIVGMLSEKNTSLSEMRYTKLLERWENGWTVEQDLKAQLEDQQRLARQANARTACAYVKPGWPRLQCQDAARK